MKLRSVVYENIKSHFSDSFHRVIWCAFVDSVHFTVRNRAVTYIYNKVAISISSSVNNSVVNYFSYLTKR